MPLDRRAPGADRTRFAMCPIAGVVDIAYGRRRPRETSGTFAWHDGTKKESLIEAETDVAHEVAAVAREASPAVWSGDTVTSTPSAPNKRLAAHVESDTPSSPQETAGQLHRGALRSNAGPNLWFPTLNTGNEIASAKSRSSLRGKILGAASQQLPDRCGLPRHDLTQTSLVSGKTKAEFRAQSSISTQPQVFRRIDIDELLSSPLNLSELSRRNCRPVRVELGRQ